MPGWCVVLKKETRSRRVTSTEEDHTLGQEASRDDLQVLANVESQRSDAIGADAESEDSGQERSARRRNRDEVR